MSISVVVLLIACLNLANMMAIQGTSAMLAGYLPARRAAKTDPVTALRYA